MSDLMEVEPGRTLTDLASHDGEVAQLLRKAYGCFPTGVVGVCAVVDGQPAGMAVSSFVPVSIDPPLLSFCVQNSSNTWARLATASRLGVSFLEQRHDRIARRLASKGDDKFDGIDLTVTPNGAALVKGAVVWVECGIEDVLTAGDHSIVLLRIIALSMRPHIEPLVFHASAFRQLQKECGASPRA